METYIAFFDILGFKEFIGNNEVEYIDKNFRHVFRESQTALSGEKYTQYLAGNISPDLEQAEVNCLHFSDSVIFWTNDASEENFKKIINVCYTFYWHSLRYSFPVRGCLVLGAVNFKPFQFENNKGIKFFNNSIYGKGAVDAYVKAEGQDWAGCYVDKSAVNSVTEQVIYSLVYSNKLVYYPVPLKNGTSSYEHVIRIVGGPLNNVAFRNLARSIESVFSRHMNGKPLPESVTRKQNNTIKFLEYFLTQGEADLHKS